MMQKCSRVSFLRLSFQCHSAKELECDTHYVRVDITR